MSYLRIFKIGIFAIAMASSTAAMAGKWSGWDYLGEKSSVKLYFKWKSTSCGFSVRYRAVNAGSSAYWVSVQNKKYICQRGSNDTASGESVSTNLKPGRSESTIEDTCICQNGGGMKGVSVQLKLRTP